jgi:hypothetical protein
MRRLTVALALVAVSLAAAAWQVTVDRVLRRINGEIITLSDVRQARTLKLYGSALGSGDASDAAILRELENRVLVLAEVARAALPDPTGAERAARRAAWERSLGAGADAAALLERHGLTSAGLDDWCRNDLRIDRYLTERFKAVAEPDRARAIGQWIDGLRARAGLKSP